MKPIRMCGTDYATVQDALLFVLLMHDKFSSGVDGPVISPEGRYQYLVSRLLQIRAGIAERAISDEVKT